MRYPLVLVAALFFIFSGCGSSEVKVTPDAKPKGNSGAPIDFRADAPGFGGGLPRRARAAGRIFFDRVLVDHGAIQTVIALSFASPLSRTKIPFGISLRLGRGLEAGPVFSMGLNQVAYLRSNGGLRSSLVATTMNSMKSQVLADFAVPVTSFSLSQPHDQIAWIEGPGKTFVSAVNAKAAGQAPLELNLPQATDQATRVEWDQHGRRLLVRTQAGAALLYAQGKAGLGLVREVPGIVAAAFSPDSTQLALIKENRSLEVIELSEHPTRAAAVATTVASALVLESAQVHDFAWRRPHELSYWIRQPTGRTEIRTFDVLSGVETAHAELSVPAGAADGVVCPVWLGDTVYFGNFLNGEYLIERMRVLAGVVVARDIFAQPPAPDEGFICPKLESTSTP